MFSTRPGPRKTKFEIYEHHLRTPCPANINFAFWVCVNYDPRPKKFVCLVLQNVFPLPFFLFQCFRIPRYGEGRFSKNTGEKHFGEGRRHATSYQILTLCGSGRFFSGKRMHFKDVVPIQS